MIDHFSIIKMAQSQTSCSQDILQLPCENVPAFRPMSRFCHHFYSFFQKASYSIAHIIPELQYSYFISQKINIHPRVCDCDISNVYDILSEFTERRTNGDKSLVM